nr:reverse transcriptase domain-containing protein [Tanacetum cinerariifolium]
MFERTIGENRASWSDKLDVALWAFRTAYKTPIGCTPYKLVYGKACHLPIELEHKAYWALKQANFDLAVAGDHQKVQLNELNELRDHSYENSLIYKEKTKRIHDSKIKNRVFNVGDRDYPDCEVSRALSFVLYSQELHEPDNSLSMGDEHLDTILATKSDEFIKSSVENLIPILSESEGIPDHRCDVPSHDNSPPLDVLKDQFEDLSESNEEFSSIDDDSFSFDKIDYLRGDGDCYPGKVDVFLAVEDEPTSSQFPKSYLDPEGDMLLLEAFLNDDHSSDFKTKSSSTSRNSLLEETNNFNNSLLEFTTFSKEDIRLIEKFLYDNSSPRPPKEFISTNSDAKIKSFSPSPILVKDSDSLMEEIDLFCTPDYPMLPGIEDKDYDSERDILIPKDLPRNNTLSFAEKESFHFDILSFSRPLAKPLDGDIGILNIKMMGDIYDQKAFMHKLMITLAPHQEKSPDLLSHLGLKAFPPFATCPMMIYGQNNPILDVLLFHFYPP